MLSSPVKRATALIAAAAIALLAACASAGSRSSGPTPPVQLVIKNNLGLPTDLTVYAVTRGGFRTLIGDVPPAATRSFTFKPVSFSERYQLLAYRPLKRPIRSEHFSVGDDLTGTIVWTLVPNIVGFEEIDTDSTGTDTTSQHR